MLLIRGTPMKLRNKIKADLYRSNKTMNDLADCMGISSSALCNRLNRANGMKLGTVKKLIESMNLLTGLTYTISDIYTKEGGS